MRGDGTPADGKVYLFDTDRAKWSLLPKTQSGTPPARVDHAMATAPEAANILVFGGRMLGARPGAAHARAAGGDDDRASVRSASTAGGGGGASSLYDTRVYTLGLAENKLRGSIFSQQGGNNAKLNRVPSGIEDRKLMDLAKRWKGKAQKRLLFNAAKQRLKKLQKGGPPKKYKETRDLIYRMMDAREARECDRRTSSLVFCAIAVC